MRCYWYPLVLFPMPQLIHGWGDVGHRTVAYLAEKYLSAEGTRLVEDLLHGDGEDISDAAVWPDTIKFPKPYTRPWHYIDALDDPPNTCRVSYEQDCDKEGCIVSAFENMTHHVYDPNWDKAGQAESLKFLMHFIGDIHHPLHVEAKGRGGNDYPVCFDRRCANENLHSIWDTDIPHKINGIKHNLKHNDEKEAAAGWATRLFQSNASRDLRAECTDVSNPVKCAMAWATETNKLNCQYVFKKGIDWLMENNLGGEYYEGAAPLVEEQILKAGIRLAGWVNALAAERGSEEALVRQDL
ncbi:hypothetical protein BBP40_003613 [Aspergillus hancockii]|nr:hypothetical protein BBP40_003613 [Aspergillus hancockii]